MSTVQSPPMGWPMTMMPGVTPDLEGWLRKMGHWPKVMEVARNVRVGATPNDVVYEEDKLKLRRYHSDSTRKFRTPLVVTFALVNRPYILDLMPHKSVVQRFLDAGFDVYLIDWGVPTASDRHLSTHDYVDRYMLNVVNYVRETTGVDRVSMLGYCMGGTMSAMFTSLYQELIENLIIMAAPIDFSKQESLLSAWCDPKIFDVDKVIDAYGNMPPQWLQGSFMLLKPIANLIDKYQTFYDKMEDEKFLTDFFAMETWINDNIPVAGATFKEFVKNLYQRNELIQGKFRIGRRTVDLTNITCPVINLVATEDHLVPPSQSIPFNNVIRSTDRTMKMFEAGHIGLSVSGRAQRQLWPEVCEWLATRSEPLS